MIVSRALVAARREPDRAHSTIGRRARRRLLGIAATAAALACWPASALAHGPVAPVASSYQARIAHVPAGLAAKVVDADQRLWLRTSGRSTVIVLDYRGAPYLRFSRAGVAVNERSEMYFLNANPVEAVPTGLTRRTRPAWSRVSSAPQYVWHDGRLQALAAVAVAPGTVDVGTWRIPLEVAGRPATIAGQLDHAPDPSPVWFWPALVIIACALAAWRVRRTSVDVRVGRLLALAALVAVTVVGIGRGTYGRPAVSVFQLVELSLLLAFVAAVLWRLVSGRFGFLTLLVVSVVALYEDLVAFPVLLHGYVLMSVPPALARAAVTVCIGATAALLPVAIRIGDRTPLDPEDPELLGPLDDEAEEAWT
jgi:hypothetical protein